MWLITHLKQKQKLFKNQCDAENVDLMKILVDLDMFDKLFLKILKRKLKTILTRKW